jgi:hypothetical protein
MHRVSCVNCFRSKNVNIVITDIMGGKLQLIMTKVLERNPCTEVTAYA